MAFSKRLTHDNDCLLFSIQYFCVNSCLFVCVNPLKLMQIHNSVAKSLHVDIYAF